LNEVFLFEIFFALFVINDTDFSGTMELDEFLETLASLGRNNFDKDAAKRLMAEYDKDESGSIDANEFGQIMLKEFCSTDIPKGDLVDSVSFYFILISLSF
jgi:Ca2+-binding EF-hand superfamily protein